MNSKQRFTLYTFIIGLLMGCGGGGSSTLNTLYVGITPDSVSSPTTLYVTDYSYSVLKSINISSGLTTIIAGRNGTSGATNATTGTAASFNGIEGVALVGANLFAVDAFNHGVRQVSTIAPYAVSTFAGNLGTAGSADNTTGSLATFNRPRNVVADSSGNLYVTDSANKTVRMITTAGTVTTIATGFTNPWGITIDNASPQNLYVTDIDANSVKKLTNISGTWSVSTFAGSLTGTSGLPSNATGTAALFNQPAGITTDNTNLYVVDSSNHAIRQIVIATQAVTTIAGSSTGTAGSTNSATGTSATFYYPIGITYAQNNLYLIDQNGSSIRVISTASGNAVSTMTLH